MKQRKCQRRAAEEALRAGASQAWNAGLFPQAGLAARSAVPAAEATRVVNRKFRVSPMLSPERLQSLASNVTPQLQGRLPTASIHISYQLIIYKAGEILLRGMHLDISSRQRVVLLQLTVNYTLPNDRRGNDLP
jgi:hypothetical protein